MKRIAFTLVITAAALGWSASAPGQSPAPSPAPAAATPAAAEPTPKPPTAYKVVEPRIVVDYPTPSQVDPRVCLEFPTQAQIIACANRYLPGKRRY